MVCKRCVEEKLKKLKDYRNYYDSFMRTRLPMSTEKFEKNERIKQKAEKNILMEKCTQCPKDGQVIYEDFVKAMCDLAGYGW